MLRLKGFIVLAVFTKLQVGNEDGWFSCHRVLVIFGTCHQHGLSRSFGAKDPMDKTHVRLLKTSSRTAIPPLVSCHHQLLHPFFLIIIIVMCLL